MPSYPISPDEKGLAVCEFCGIRFEKKDGLNDEMFSYSSFFVPERNTLVLDQHLQEHHNYQPCFSKPTSERTFTRKDKLQQHLVQVHGVHTMSKFMVTKWKFQVNQNLRFTCGFCGSCLDSWDERAHHVASHFENGKEWSSWQRFPIKAEAVSIPRTSRGQMFESINDQMSFLGRFEDIDMNKVSE